MSDISCNHNIPPANVEQMYWLQLEHIRIVILIVTPNDDVIWFRL